MLSESLERPAWLWAVRATRKEPPTQESALDASIDDILSEPTEEVVDALRDLLGDVLVLGAGGKMGPTLSLMAQRALNALGSGRRAVAVSRFSADGSRRKLESLGVRTIACDLLDRSEVARLPDAPTVVFMVGRKFGSTGAEGLTWATNAVVPSLVCERFRRSRIVAFSTGNVYGLTAVASGGSREEDPLRPVGEYSMSCVGRERIFGHFSVKLGIPVAVVRLNYACELRYGVLVDLARKVWRGETVDVSMGHFNVIWQGDASAAALRCAVHASVPPFVINVTGPELLSVREVCEELGRLLGIPVRLRGKEAADAILSDTSKALRLLGPPRVSATQLLRRVAEWVRAGGESFEKPTHFEVRDGTF